MIRTTASLCLAAFASACAAGAPIDDGVRVELTSFDEREVADQLGDDWLRAAPGVFVRTADGVSHQISVGRAGVAADLAAARARLAAGDDDATLPERVARLEAVSARVAPTAGVVGEDHHRGGCQLWTFAADAIGIIDVYHVQATASARLVQGGFTPLAADFWAGAGYRVWFPGSDVEEGSASDSSSNYRTVRASSGRRMGVSVPSQVGAFAYANAHCPGGYVSATVNVVVP